MTEERQTNYTISEGYELPSGGKIYPVQVDPHIELRSMTARDEMKRLSPSTTQFKTMSNIIEGCMLEKPAVHVYDMALGDYEYLLHRLRVVTYGDSYKMSAVCPFCGHRTELTAHLDELDKIEFDEARWQECQTFQLPRSGDTITIKYQTPRMIDELDGRVKELKRKMKDAEIQFDLLVLLTQVIDTVNGEKYDTTKLETYINKLPALDVRVIQDHLDALNSCIGIKHDITVTCDGDGCGEDFITYFRFGSEFFRPTTF